jgi:rhodanese-related sulfurtransferase
MKTALLALLFAVSSVAYAADGAFGDINHADLTKALEAKTVTVIDVNGTESFKTGRIPGAIDFEAQGKELASKLPADKNALVVAYCGSPQCSAWKSAAKAVAALGYTNVKHYSGGISGWKDAGGKLEQN